MIKICQITVFGKIPMTFFVNSPEEKQFNAGGAKARRRKGKKRPFINFLFFNLSLDFTLRLCVFAPPALNTLILIAVSHLGGKCADAVFV